MGVGREWRAQAARRLIERAGLRMEFRGRYWRIWGRGVDLLVERLDYISGADLLPVHHRSLRGLDRD